MVSVRKKAATAAAVLICVCAVWGLVYLLFQPFIEKAETGLEIDAQRLSRLENLIAKSRQQESDWELYRPAFAHRESNHEVILNQWVDGLLGFSSEHEINFTKLEPQGVRRSKKEKRNEMRLYLAFTGEITDFTALLNYLREKEVLSRIEFFVIKQDKQPGDFFFEMILGKAAL